MPRRTKLSFRTEVFLYCVECSLSLGAEMDFGEYVEASATPSLAIAGISSKAIPAFLAMACARRRLDGCESHFSLHLLHCNGCIFSPESLNRAEIAARGS